ncbi:hypothetical protein [Microvirga sp. CF3016]|uniref:hypothetical protein n=1 Tax=Microvirga sp. CF3016 TaxID=3110181 RepID=UPI002E796606|nr:hypothetical protein [Microvirga sp. CF3016]MEE1609847.1 hypothetical protein [Microvirga sp. CF3016]
MLQAVSAKSLALPPALPPRVKATVFARMALAATCRRPDQAGSRPNSPELSRERTGANINAKTFC